MKVRNIGPFSQGLTIAATGQDVPRGDTVDVSDELGLGLCEQVDNWAPVGEEATALVVEHIRRREAEADADETSERGLAAAAKRAAAAFEPLPELRNPAVAQLSQPDEPDEKPKKRGVKPAETITTEG